MQPGLLTEQEIQVQNNTFLLQLSTSLKQRACITCTSTLQRVYMQDPPPGAEEILMIGNSIRHQFNKTY